MKKNLLFLLKTCRSKKDALFLFVLFLNIIGALLEGSSYFLMISAFNVLSGTPFTNPLLSFFLLSNQSFVFIITLAIISQVLKSSFCLSAAILNAHLAMHLQMQLHLKIHAQIFRLSYSCVHRYNQGELLSYAQSPHNFVRPFLEQFNHLIVAIFLCLVSLSILCVLSLPLTLFTLILFSIALFAQKGLFKKSKLASSQLTKEMEFSNIMTLQHVSGIKIVHLFNQQSHFLKSIQKISQKFARVSKKILTLSAISHSVNEVIGTIVVSLCMLVGFWFFSQKSDHPLPLLLGFITVAYRMSGKVLGGMDNINKITTQKGHLEQIITILNDNDKVFLREQGKPMLSFEREIQFHRVSFKYPGNTSLAITNASCKIHKGTVVAIVGATGAGKSTILDLLGGLYEPTSGKILIDGISLSDIELLSWRKKLAYVNQDIVLFQDSIENNIRIGRAEASQEEIILAAKKACAHVFISQLPLNYKAQIGEQGHRLSGGEKQRIALARALVRNAEIIILDEATSNLDYESESLIQMALKDDKKEHTWLVIAHRLSTIIDADQILFLDQGQIKEVGTHEQLMLKAGLYAKLWASQFQTQSQAQFI